MTPEQIITQAIEMLADVDNEIAALRAEKRAISRKIAELLEQRKPMARIVNAATPRRQNVDHGESE